MDKMKHRRLQELDRSDFQIVDGEPDVRGWDVKDSSSRKIGEVEELILDAKEKKVRYMVVDLNSNDLNFDRRKVLVPIGLAELDRTEDDVLIPNVSPQQFGELPAYDRNQLTPDVERRIFSTLDRRPQAAPKREASTKKETGEIKDTRKDKKGKNDEVDPDFYRHEYYNLDNLYKNRMHEAKSAGNKNESEFERSLRLWERRSEGTMIPGDARKESGAHEEYINNQPEINEESRMEMIRNRRINYQQKRYPDDRSQDGRENDVESKDDQELRND
jgi:sporulation protein YlmC with PRC-barrel domain